MARKDPLKARVDELKAQGKSETDILKMLGGELPSQAAQRSPRGSGPSDGMSLFVHPPKRPEV
jgi:hypothetical protein